MRILVTGGAGFIGSHVAEYYAEKGEEVICYDNLSRGTLLKKEIDATHNRDYLKRFSNVKLVKGDARDFEKLKELTKNIDVIIHAAAQTAVTISVQNPKVDFEINALGTFNILEAARLSNNHPVIIYCSTNKVYGENVNKVRVVEKEIRYIFEDKFKYGIPETFPIDLCEHTPYGCSKLAGDLYVQDYGRLYNLRTAVFRMSCIYGTRQFGFEDQGWVAWFITAALTNKPITIYGNGKQVRDLLYVEDLIKAYDLFVESDLKYTVYNIGGGSENTISLLEFLDILEQELGRKPKVTFSDRRPSDQKVYISHISKIKKELDWQPVIDSKEGVERVIEWVKKNIAIFS